jgi:hypothetical protein
MNILIVDFSDGKLIRRQYLLDGIQFVCHCGFRITDTVDITTLNFVGECPSVLAAISEIVEKEEGHVQVAAVRQYSTTVANVVRKVRIQKVIEH